MQIQNSRLIGSPPHGRGKGFSSRWTGIGMRITPAWAGKRSKNNSQEKTGTDHPRMGGEKSCRTSATPTPWGSPPHGRGKDENYLHHGFEHGITPAWAGKRICLADNTSLHKDHPRMGGEKPVLSLASSMPRRITPAWAGKRSISKPIKSTPADHPRMGGEKDSRGC